MNEIKIFPYYKGKCIANSPLGYTTKANARRRMKTEDVVKDFEATLPEDYWFYNLYTYDTRNAMRTHRYYSVSRGFSHIVVNDYGSEFNKVYLKDIDNTEVISLFRELDNFFDIPISKKTNEDYDKAEKIALRLNELGYYPYAWKDDNDYKKKLSKYITKHVEFREMEVNVELSPINT